MQIKKVTAILALSFVCFVTAAPIQDATPVQPTTTTLNHDESDDSAAAEATVAHEQEHEHEHEHDEPQTTEHFDSPFDLLLEKVKADGVKIQSVPGKGLGLVATRDLPAGTRIFEEKPVLFVADPDDEAGLYAQYQALAFYEQHLIDHLASGHTTPSPALEHDVWDLYDACTSREKDTPGFFMMQTHMTVGCVPNSEFTWHPSEQIGYTYLTKDVKAGEEITKGGNPPWVLSWQRQEFFDAVGYRCHCTACNEGSSLSDLRRIMSRSFIDYVDGKAPMRARIARSMGLEAIIEEGHVGTLLTNAYLRLSRDAFAEGDVYSAKSYAEKADANEKKCVGDNDALRARLPNSALNHLKDMTEAYDAYRALHDTTTADETDPEANRFDPETMQMTPEFLTELLKDIGIFPGRAQ